MFSDSKTMLITGGCGFIGTNFVRHVMMNRWDLNIINVDKLTYAGKRENLSDFEGGSIDGGGRYEFVEGDVCDKVLMKRLIDRSDVVVHMAAESHVDRSIADAGVFVRTNVTGTQVTLDAMREVDPKHQKRLVYVSTDEVYGELQLEDQDEKFTEETALNPSSPYSASKAAADMLVRAYGKTYGMDVVVTRCSNNFGPYQYPEKIIPLFITNLMQGKKLPVYGDGENVRDWIYVEDHATALLRVVDQGERGEVYNIGAGCEISNLQLTKMILQEMGMGEEMIEFVKDRPGHDRRYALDTRKIRENLNWAATESELSERIRQTIRWYDENSKNK